MKIKNGNGKITLKVSAKEMDAITAALYGLYSQEQATDIMKEYQRQYQQTCYDLYIDTEIARWNKVIR